MEKCLFQFKNISKSFGGNRVLNEVNFDLAEGEVLGLIGENGAGKSTLMNILGGIVSHDEGSMSINGESYNPTTVREASQNGVEFIQQELNLFANLSVAENIFLIPPSKKTVFINKRDINAKSRILLKDFDLNIDPKTLVENLSPGEKQMVEIIKAVNKEGKIYIFDEPTTSLTEKEIRNLYEVIKKLKSKGKSIVYISHILEEVQDLCDSLCVLRDGNLVASGKISEFSTHKMILSMIGRELKDVFPTKTNTIGETELLRVDGVSKEGIVGDISFSVHKGEIVGIFGLMGSGRTELMKMIFGIDSYDTGNIFVNGNQLKKKSPSESIKSGISFVTEDRRNEGLLMRVPIVRDLSLVVENQYINYKPLPIIDRKKLAELADEIKTKLNIKSANIHEQIAGELSGGNQQKVVIAKWLLRNPTMFILDEPTRGIDVGAKFEVYSLINKMAEQGDGLLVVSSEVEELMGISDRIIVMNRGRMIEEFLRKDFKQESLINVAFGN